MPDDEMFFSMVDQMDENPALLLRAHDRDALAEQLRLRLDDAAYDIFLQYDSVVTEESADMLYALYQRLRYPRQAVSA